MSYKKSILYALNATCSHVVISPGIFLLFCMAVCYFVIPYGYTRLLSLGMAICDYTRLLSL